ncbi:MAG: helix-turn-helix transcriptional regulator [Tenericutes bacterium]|jgi:transcriptional regulator with XRE-family HTH domain|nr:helix-turn-helix transcriptional regulator [Mycoplasmatota bacterium]
MDTEKLANYIESLRYKRKLKQEEFIDKVTSPRQYQRYRAGESQMPISVIYKFANKLNINPRKLLLEYDEQIIKETEEVMYFFNLVINKKIVEANQKMAKLLNQKFIDDENFSFFEISKALLEFCAGSHTRFTMISQIKKTIKYDLVFKETMLTNWELYGLGILLEHSEDDSKEILDKLISLQNGNLLYALGRNLYANLQIYYWVVKNLGKLERYKEVIDNSTKAIDLCHRNYSYYSIHRFFYFRALAKYRLNQDSYKEDLSRIFYLSKTFNYIDVEFYTKLFKKDFNIDFYEYQP